MHAHLVNNVGTQQSTYFIISYFMVTEGVKHSPWKDQPCFRQWELN